MISNEEKVQLFKVSVDLFIYGLWIQQKIEKLELISKEIVEDINN